MIKNDQLTIEIFSFVDTTVQAKEILMKLNSQGRKLACNPAYD
jgi:hypothetical protein